MLLVAGIPVTAILKIRFGENLVNLNDILYYMGGERATETKRNAPRKNTFFLNPITSDKWIETDSLHFARNGMAAVVLNGKVYAAGGSGGGPGGPPPTTGQAVPRPSRPEQNHPVDLEIFILK